MNDCKSFYFYIIDEYGNSNSEQALVASSLSTFLRDFRVRIQVSKLIVNLRDMKNQRARVRVTHKLSTGSLIEFHIHFNAL
jgi:hypothetical protein